MARIFKLFQIQDNSVSFSFHLPYRELLDDPLDLVPVSRPEGLVVGPVEPGARLALRAEVLVDLLGLALQDSHAATVEPVRAALAADVEPGEKDKKEE